MVTADGLSGPVDSLGWWQHNAYYRYPASELPGGEQFCEPADEYMHLTFDDVVSLLGRAGVDTVGGGVRQHV